MHATGIAGSSKSLAQWQLYRGSMVISGAIRRIRVTHHSPTILPSNFRGQRPPLTFTLNVLVAFVADVRPGNRGHKRDQPQSNGDCVGGCEGCY
jgi:hypothetical protein